MLSRLLGKMHSSSTWHRGEEHDRVWGGRLAIEPIFAKSDDNDDISSAKISLLLFLELHRKQLRTSASIFYQEALKYTKKYSSQLLLSTIPCTFWWTMDHNLLHELLVFVFVVIFHLLFFWPDDKSPQVCLQQNTVFENYQKLSYLNFQVNMAKITLICFNSHSLII